MKVIKVCCNTPTCIWVSDFRRLCQFSSCWAPSWTPWIGRIERWVEQRCQISPERYLTIEIGVVDPPNASGKAIGFNAGIWLVQQSIEADKEKITGCRIRDTVGRKISWKDCMVSKENYVPCQVHRCRGVWPKKTLITRLLWRNLSEITFFINIIRMLCKNFNLPQSCPCWIQSGSPAT